MGKHSPHRLASYQEIHETVMDHWYRGGFVISDSLSFTSLPGAILIEGKIHCKGGVYIEVFKKLSILSGEGANAMVQTVAYTYNVALQGIGNIFRYDSPHPTHNQFHHLHQYDPFDESGDNTLTEVPPDNWPTLGEVIEEAAEWYFNHLDEL